MIENKKIKLLIVPSDGQGVGHFRSIWPAQAISKYHSNEFDVEINLHPNFDNIEYFKQFDIIHYHRHFGPHERMDSLFAELRSAGVVLIMDIDDFWEPATTHPLFEIVRKEGLTQKIKEVVEKSQYVTTTTNIFANHIKPLNKNVYVIPNALNMEDKMWTSEVMPNQTDKCRISWIGGSSHHHDLKLMEQSIKMLYGSKDLEDRFQFVMCGFDTRGTITEIRPDGSKNSRNIQPHETIWMKFEEIFTANYKEQAKDPEYFKWLSKIKREEYPDMYKKNYIRRWTLPLTQYGKHYDYCDVCLAPIDAIDRYKTEKGQIINRTNYFNEVKSELKIIEAGMKKKALIAQDFGIYKELLKDGETGILISDNKDGWYKAMKKVIQDSDYRNMLAENLHNFVRDKYDLKNVTAKRIEVYKTILNEVKNTEGRLKRDAKIVVA
jgi:glycosyltransferase involved in cell wall biosynthesis